MNVQADSLLQAGEVYTDSIALYSAVQALNQWRWLLPTDYARACFFYGRLLRIEEDYARSMPYFINARHACTCDDGLLGRVYSNIAYICRLEGSYPLAYDMYECSAGQFLHAGDTVRYLIARTNMAYALAEQGDTCGVQAIIAPIGQSCPTPSIVAMCDETCAEAFMRAGDYLTALRYAGRINPPTPSVLMIKGQCFSQLGQCDSATCYARQVVGQTDHPFLLVNALFILTQQDSTADLPGVRSVAAQRAVVLKQIAVNQGDLSRAVELLRQDLDVKPIHLGLLPVSMLCLLIVLIAWWLILRRQRKREMTRIAQERQQAQAFISAREEQNALLQQQFDERRAKIEQEITQNIDALRHADDWRKTLCWNNYEQFCEVVNKHFFLLADKLKAAGQLNEKELRLCMLVLMDCFDSRQMATILYYGESGIRNFKQHTAKKLGTTSRDLREHLFRMMTGEA